MSDFDPTSEQLAILEDFRQGKSLKIHAFAGTGKTTTLHLLAQNTSKKGLYIAFNKRVSTQAKKTMPSHVSVSTVHGLAWKWAVGTYNPEKLFKSLNVPALIRQTELPYVDGFSKYRTATTLSLILNSFCYSQSKSVNEDHLPFEHKNYVRDRDTLKKHSRSLVASARSIWKQMCEPTDQLPLGHDGYLKLWSLSEPKMNFEFIMIDEAQDLSPVMLSSIESFDGQVILVGDSQQQIYSWRGAVDALKHPRETVEHFLTLTFRFGSELADLANILLKALSVEKAIISNTDDGSIIQTEHDSSTDAFIFRKNETLIRKAVELYEQDKPFYIADPNKNIELSVLDYFRLQEGLWGKSEAFQGFNSWEAVLQVASTQEMTPFRGFVELFESFPPNVILAALEASKKREGKTYPTLTTGHQAKGMEWNNVRLSEDFLMADSSIEDEVAEENMRLLYVALTRAKRVMSLPEELKFFIEEEISKPRGKFAVIDLETTGLSPEAGDRIIEIGVVIWDKGRIVEKYQTLVNPKRRIDYFIEDLTGISNEMVKDAPTSKDALTDMMRKVGNIPLVAHNGSFERKFLNNELGKLDKKYFVGPICTMLLARRLFPNFSSYKLGELVNELGLPKGEAHRALSDSVMTAHLLTSLTNELAKEAPGRSATDPNLLFGITKIAPKQFREMGIESSLEKSHKLLGRVKYLSYDFSKEDLSKAKDVFEHVAPSLTELAGHGVEGDLHKSESKENAIVTFFKKLFGIR